MVNPLSLEEAERVFTPAERRVAAELVDHQLRNARQRLRRIMTKATRALADFDQRIGSPLDILDFERHAEQSQLTAGDIDGFEKRIAALLAVPGTEQ